MPARTLRSRSVECPVCAEAWRLAIAFTPGKAAAPANRPTPSAWLRPKMAWAAAALLLAAGAAMLLRAPEPDPVSREPVRELRPLVPSVGSLPRDAFRLQWSGGPPDARYDLVVTTSDLQPVVTVRGLEHAEYLVPAERLSGTPSGARLLWRVTARTAAGGAVASPTFEVGLE